MLEKLKQPSQARTVRGDIPIYHRYTLGVAGERFFKAMRDQRQILASPCPKCHDHLLPPKMYCERCEDAVATIGGIGAKDLDRPGHRESNPMTAGSVIQYVAGHVRDHANQIAGARRLIRQKL